MGKLTTLKEALTHPISAAVSAFGAIGSLLNPDVAIALVGAVYSAAPTLFTGASVASFTLPQVFPALTVIKPFFLGIIAVAGPLYLLRIVLRSTEIFEREL